MSFLSQLYSTLRSALEGARTITSDDAQMACWEKREVVISISAQGQDGGGSVVLQGKRMTNTVSATAVFEWSRAVRSPLPFAVAVWIVPSGAPCAQVVNGINRERQGRRQASARGLFCSALLGQRHQGSKSGSGTLECVFYF